MAVKIYDKPKRSIRRWLLRKLPACQQAVEQISQSMERPLTVRERITLKLHLWVCVWCRWYLEHLHLIRDTARAHADEPPDFIASVTLSSDARERIRRRITNQN